MALSRREIDCYEREGLVIPDFRLAAHKLDTLRGALDEVIAMNPQVPPEKLISPHIEGHSEEGTRGHRAFLDFAHDDSILDLVEDLIGPDLILWGCAIISKVPGEGKAVPWHQDGHYWPIRPISNCSVWVALDDSTVANGAMQYIPGSHDGTAYSHHNDDGEHLALNQVLDGGQVEESTAKSVELQAGQVSLHHVHLVHGSPPNTSPQRRGAVIYRYMPATSHFDRAIPTKSPGFANYADRPIWLVRGEDRTGKNDFRVGK